MLKRLMNLFSETPKPLGRWKTENWSQTKRKIDLSNEDHCGPCELRKPKPLKSINSYIINEVCKRR